MNLLRIILSVCAIIISGYNTVASALVERDLDAVKKVYTTSTTPGILCDTSTDCTSFGVIVCGPAHTSCTEGTLQLKIKID